MVTAANRRGTSLFGCLLSVALFGIAAWYGGTIGLVYWRRYEVLDEMKVAVRHAASLPDATIRNRLNTTVEEVFGPERVLRFTIARPRGRQSIVIETQYRDSVSLPLFKRGFRFQLRVQSP